MRTTLQPGLIGLSILAGLVIACGSWQVQGVTPERVIERQRPEKLLVTRTDSTRLVVEGAGIRQDSLVGSRGKERVALPLSEVAYVSVRRGSSLPVAIMGSVVIVVGTFCLVFCGY